MSTVVVAMVPIVIFSILAAIVTVPYVSLGPGPTFNTLGEVGGKPVVAIQGATTYPTSGHLNMTTVSQRDGLTLGQALTAWLSGREQLIPRDLVFSPDKTSDDIKKEQQAAFERSEFNAEYAALNYLKYPAAVSVEVVNDPGPAAGILQSGDAIDAVNGIPVPTVEAFTSVLKTTQPGQNISVDYRRKNAPAGTARITLGETTDRDYGYVGIAVLQAPWAPFVIDFNLANVGGPSAGLMFSLAVVDKLTAGELNGSKFIAGTGTITENGQIGPIGGITHKIVSARRAGATVFLVPARNCAEARSVHDDTIKLVKVETLSQTIDALGTVNAGGAVLSC